MLAMLSPVLYALGDHVLSGNADMSPPLWRSSPRRRRPRRLRAAQPEPLGLGRRRPWAARPVDGLRRRYPEAVGSLSLVCARRDRRRLVARRLAGLPHPRRRHDLLRPAGARPVPPGRGRQHADPDALERAPLRAGPGSGAIAGPLRGPGDDGGRGALRAGARARSAAAIPSGGVGGSRPSASSWRSSWCPGRARSTPRGFPRSIRPSPRTRGPTSACSSCPSACSDGTSSFGNFQRPHAVLPDAARQGHHRRLPVARLAASAGATHGARPS